MFEEGWLGETYRQDRRRLFLVAWNVLRCASLAEDAVHSAFVGLTRMRKPPQDPRLYVFRAVRNAALDIAKARARRREQPIPVDVDRTRLESSPVEEESLLAVETALEQLDEIDREVIELHLHAELTFQEIGSLLEQPLPTVASRYRRAIEKLRRILEVCHERE